MFQNQALFPHLTAAENVAYGLGRKTDSETRGLVRGALALVGLDGAAIQRPEVLGDAERRLLAFARALARRPRVLLLDNPLAGLVGPAHDTLLARFVAIQRATGLTMVLATDDPDTSLAAADRALVLDAGHVHQIGGPEDLRLRPASRHVARYVGRLNLLEGVVAGLSEVEVPDLGRLICAIAGQRGNPVVLGIAPSRVVLSDRLPPRAALALRARRPIFQGGARRLLLETGDGRPFVAPSAPIRPRATATCCGPPGPPTTR